LAAFLHAAEIVKVIAHQFQAENDWMYGGVNFINILREHFCTKVRPKLNSWPKKAAQKTHV